MQREAFGDVDDTSLLRSVAQGDERALTVLYDRHARWLLLRLARRAAGGLEAGDAPTLPAGATAG